MEGEGAEWTYNVYMLPRLLFALSISLNCSLIINRHDDRDNNCSDEHLNEELMIIDNDSDPEEVDIE